MSATAFRVYFDDVSATRQQLDRMERIVVTQEMDLVWEAEISMHTVLTSSGDWLHRAEEFPPLTRVRIEITQDGNTWVPLIEGPISRSESQLSSEPGSSEVQLRVRDDSVFLNRTQSAHTYAFKTEAEIITTVLSEYQTEQGAAVPFTQDISVIPGDLPRNAARRQTAMQFLRQLARQRGWHAYVLPAAARGAPSQFCYKPKATAPSGLPELTLLGDGRTLQSFHLETNPEGPQNTSGMRIDFTNGQLVSQQSSGSAPPDLLANVPAVDQPAERLADPRHSTPLDAQAEGSSSRSSYAYRARGQVTPGRYAGILLPYQVVSVRAGRTGLSADYLLRKVTHTLSRHVYTQEFEALARNIHTVSSSSAPAIPGIS
jgi:hypothetical protein